MSPHPVVAKQPANPLPDTNEGPGVTVAPLANVLNGRTTEGRFAKGNPGGRGNPFNRRLAEIRRALLTPATQAELDERVDELLLLAKSGDLAAIQLLLTYTIGTPTAVVDPNADPDPLHQPVRPPPSQTVIPPSAATIPSVPVPETPQAQAPCRECSAVDSNRDPCTRSTIRQLLAPMHSVTWGPSANGVYSSWLAHGVNQTAVSDPVRDFSSPVGFGYSDAELVRCHRLQTLFSARDGPPFRLSPANGRDQPGDNRGSVLTSGC